MSELVQIKTIDSITTVTMNRPELFNALNLEMAQLLSDTCRQIGHNSNTRCMIIRGSGGNFLAGGDISSFKAALDEKDEAYIRDLIHYANTTVSTIREMPIPVIACVEGAVAGYGLSLMLACDLVIASDSSKFLTAYSLIGASPDGGMTYHLPHAVGIKKAFELCTLSQPLNAQQALEIGIVNQLVSPSELGKKAQNLAVQLAAGPRHAYGRIKQLINQSMCNDLNQQLTAEENGFLEGFQSQEFLEGVAAFSERRQPNY